MAELPKFYTDETTPSESPIAEASIAWEDYYSHLRRDYRGILGISRAAIDDIMYRPPTPNETFDDRKTLLTISIEENISEGYPDFAIAANGLRTALNRLRGTAITWNHYQRGEVEAMDLTDLKQRERGDMYIYTLRRAMTTYPELNGHLIDNAVGSAAPLAEAQGGYPVMLQIGFEPTDTNGLWTPIDDMFAIREQTKET